MSRNPNSPLFIRAGLAVLAALPAEAQNRPPKIIARASSNLGAQGNNKGGSQGRAGAIAHSNRRLPRICVPTRIVHLNERESAEPSAVGITRRSGFQQFESQEKQELLNTDFRSELCGQRE